METCINYCEPGYAYISSDERKWINHIRRLAVENPGVVIIMKEPEDNDGTIYAKFPQKWIKVRPPKKMDMTDEQRAALAARFAKAREKKKEGRINE